MGSKVLKLTMLSIFLVFLLNQSVLSLSIGTVEETPGNICENGVIKGLSVDFVKEIQKRVNDKTPIKRLPGSRLIKLSLTKKNYVVFSLSRTKTRENKYHWISLVMRKPLVMFAKKGSNLNIKNLNDAKKVKAIGVMRKIKKDGTFKNLAKKRAKYTKKTFGIDAEVKNGALNFWKEKEGLIS